MDEVKALKKIAAAAAVAAACVCVFSAEAMHNGRAYAEETAASIRACMSAGSTRSP